MLTKEQVSFIVVLALATNAIWVISKIQNREETIQVATNPNKSEQKLETPATTENSSVLHRWDDAASMAKKNLACAEWGPIPDEHVIEAKTALVGNGLKDLILVKENPVNGTWVATIDPPDDPKAKKEIMQKIRTAKLPLNEDKDGNFVSAVFSDETSLKKFINFASEKSGLKLQPLIRQAPNRNTAFILKDTSDSNLLSFKKSSEMISIGEFKAIPCPGALDSK